MENIYFRNHFLEKFKGNSFNTATFEQLLDYLESFQMEIYFKFKKAGVHPTVINALLQFFSSERKNVGTKHALKRNLIYHYVVTSALYDFAEINPSEELSERLLFAFVALNFNHPDICDYYAKQVECVGRLPKEEQDDFLCKLYDVMDSRPKSNYYSASSENLGSFLYKTVLYLDEDQMKFSHSTSL